MSNARNLANLLNTDTKIETADITYPLTNFSSTGIDDNADATAITIDSSENVMIGTTDTLPSNDTSGSGIALRSDGIVAMAGSNTTPLRANRTGNDGEIIELRKDGTTVGNIGTTSGDLTMFSATSGHSGIRFHENGILPTDNSGALIDNDAVLGDASYRYTNLYLSGGVFLGGTGTANLLDDYEEGTWTPSFTIAPSGTVSSLAGQYTKIGRTVYVQFSVSGSSLAISSYARIQGLPFSATDDADTGTYVLGSIASRGHGWTTVASGQTQLYLSQSGTTSSPTILNGSLVYRAS